MDPTCTCSELRNDQTLGGSFTAPPGWELLAEGTYASQTHDDGGNRRYRCGACGRFIGVSWREFDVPSDRVYWVATVFDPSRPLPDLNTAEKTLDGTDEEAKLAVLAALGECRDGNALPPLFRRAGGPDGPLRLAASRALAQLTRELGIDIAPSALPADPRIPINPETYRRALVASRSNAIPALKALLLHQRTPTEELEGYADALAATPGAWGREVLVAALEHSDGRIRAAAAHALGDLGHLRALPLLLEEARREPSPEAPLRRIERVVYANFLHMSDAELEEIKRLTDFQDRAGSVDVSRVAATAKEELTVRKRRHGR